MPTWLELSDESLVSAELLKGNGYYRGSVNRAYYSAFSRVTGALWLIKGIPERFWHANNNPSHAQAIKMMDQLVQSGVPQASIREVKSALRTLRRKREEADYMPGHVIHLTDARTCIRLAHLIKRLIGGA